jgi:hypothetical protein
VFRTTAGGTVRFEIRRHTSDVPRQKNTGVWFFYSHPGIGLSDRDRFLVGPTRRSLESTIKPERLSGVLILCGEDAGTIVDVARALRLYPPDLGVPSPDVISALEAGSQRIINYEEGKSAD